MRLFKWLSPLLATFLLFFAVSIDAQAYYDGHYNRHCYTVRGHYHHGRWIPPHRVCRRYNNHRVY